MAEPGWYDEPEDLVGYRWWDGERWTAWTTETTGTGYPPPGPVASVPPAPPSKLTRRLLIGGGALVAGAAALSYVGQRMADDEQKAALAAYPSALGVASVEPARSKDLMTIDQESKVARIGPWFSMVMPGKPFAMEALAGRGAVFEQSLVAFDQSTPGWTTSSAWVPTLGLLGTPRSALVTGGDAGQAAAIITENVTSRFYAKAAPDRSAIDTGNTTLAGHDTGTASCLVDFDNAPGQRARANVATWAILASPRVTITWTEIFVGDLTDQQHDALDAARESIWIA